MKRSTQGDIQMLLSGISLFTASVLLACSCFKAAAVENYVDPITITETSKEIYVFEPITITLDTDEEVEETTVLVDDSDDVDPLSLIETYIEPIDEGYIPLKNGLERDYVTIYSDLHVDTCPSIEMLDKLIEWWEPRIMENRGTPFIGHGKDFYAVWKMTGMDPLIILGIAAWEGGWGNSKVAKAKYNYYGIGVYDSDPMYWASRFSDGSDTEFENVSKGIIDGALWIYENYYLDGNTNLAMINNNGYNGYNGGTYWAETITEQMINVHYRVVKEIMKEED